MLSSQTNGHDDGILWESVKLPCGAVIRNKFVKVALYEHLASLGGGPPNQNHLHLYSEWASGGWGMIITGNVQVSPTHLSLGRDLCLPPPDSTYCDSWREKYSELAHVIRGGSGGTGSLAIAQLNHCGRQSPRVLGGRWWKRPLSVSTLGLGRKTGEGIIAQTVYGLLFQNPVSATTDDVKSIIAQFTHGARMCFEAGFNGAQLHASHGYLLAQFMSPKLNNRTDEYKDGVSLIVDIIRDIRKSTSPTFVIGVKLNSQDYTEGRFGADEARSHILRLAAASVDFIEISGGDYENPDFALIDPKGRAFFADFSSLAHKAVSAISESERRPLIVLTGGLRSVDQMQRALKAEQCDLLGLGRPAVLCPNLPKVIQQEGVVSLPEPPRLARPWWYPKLVGAGVATAWYNIHIYRISRNESMDPGLGSVGVIILFWFRHWSVIYISLISTIVLIAAVVLHVLKNPKK